MTFLARLLGLRPSPPAPQLYPTDEVVPMHLFDNNSMMRSYDLFWTFRFEEVLDAEKLGSSLTHLVETGDWRKLGGRWRLNPDGNLEVHIPRPFTPQRPAIYFTQEHFDINISEHALASSFPKAGERAEIFPSAVNLAPLAYGPGAPRCIDDYLRGDFPQLSLHVVTFQDATLVSVNWNHAMTDLGGFAAIIKAWVACLNGKEPPPFMSMDDGMRCLYESPPEGQRPIIEDMILSGWRKASWIMWFLWDQVWTTTAFKSHTICIPKHQMDVLLRNCRAEAAELAATTGSDPFISEGDIAMSFAVRIAAWSLPVGSRRSVAATGAVDARYRVQHLLCPDAAYVQNAPSGIVVMRRASDILNISVGEQALGMRRDLAKQATEPQMRASAAMVAQILKDTGSLPPMGDASSFFTTCSNWSKSQLLEIMDFSAAVTTSRMANGVQTAKTQGRPVFYHSRFLTMGTFSTCLLVVHGRDANGDMWMSGHSSPRAWEKLIIFINSQK
ncbi:hypothetical protein QQS21_001931 [Conoideocrella luteorostrata]|uniref:Uncharacterized protein n=1 Tax=Conoideocrella luteorostrata TaxID=1105319 RepID=A0AAJ0D020_9HYPO|nr:hypothetical protein QQS21_001931 [Conoideocrella luteorostrata]